MNLTSLVFVLKLDETKFECAITSNVEAIDPMKIQIKINFPQNVARHIFRE